MATKQKTYHLAFDDNSIIVQDFLHPECYALLAALCRKTMTHLQIQQELSIRSPSLRIGELLDAGYCITRRFITVEGPYGRHRVAQYGLIHWYEG